MSGAAVTVNHRQWRSDQAREQWKNNLVVYMWAVNQDVDLTAGTLELPLEASFGDLWGIMKSAASALYEGRKGNWGVMLDGSCSHLGEDWVTVIELDVPLRVDVGSGDSWYASKGS